MCKISEKENSINLKYALKLCKSSNMYVSINGFGANAYTKCKVLSTNEISVVLESINKTLVDSFDVLYKDIRSITIWSNKWINLTIVTLLMVAILQM